MTTRYSPSTGNFYPLDIDYQTLPNDLIEVQKEDFDFAMSRPAGHEFRFENGNLVIIPPSDAYIKAQANASILAQIAIIERDRQPRAIRESAIGMPGSVDRLKTIDADIAALRVQLVK